MTNNENTIIIISILKLGNFLEIKNLPRWKVFNIVAIVGVITNNLKYYLIPNAFFNLGT